MTSERFETLLAEMEKAFNQRDSVTEQYRKTKAEHYLKLAIPDDPKVKKPTEAIIEATLDTDVFVTTLRTARDQAVVKAKVAEARVLFEIASAAKKPSKMRGIGLSKMPGIGMRGHGHGRETPVYHFSRSDYTYGAGHGGAGDILGDAGFGNGLGDGAGFIDKTGGHIENEPCDMLPEQ